MESFTQLKLPKIHNDMLASTDTGRVIAPTVLDFSAALDAINYNISLRGLGDWLPGAHSSGLNHFRL